MITQNDPIRSWIDANAASFDFAASLKISLARYGSLTPNQTAAVQRCIQRQAARDAAPKPQTEELGITGILNMAVLEQTFATAKSKGLKRPKLHLADFTFSLAPTTGKNPGAIYVKERNTGDYMGKITHGHLHCSAVGENRKDAIAEVASDPKTAAIAYGKKYGICAICARDLSDPESIDRGIGPVCASKFGWEK